MDEIEKIMRLMGTDLFIEPHQEKRKDRQNLEGREGREEWENKSVPFFHAMIGTILPAGPLAQRIEHRTSNPIVGSSILPGPANRFSHSFQTTLIFPPSAIWTMRGNRFRDRPRMAIGTD